MQLIQLRNQKDLTEYAEKFLMENYGLELTHPIIINGRLTSAYGRVMFTHGYKDVTSIDIAKRLMVFAHQGVILDTLKHELIHYALWKLEKPFDDNDQCFKDELVKHGATGEGEIEVGEYYKYICVKASCGKDYRVRKILGNGYTCQCNSKIKLTEKYVANGYEKETLKTY